MTDPSQQPVGLVRLGYGLGYIAHLHVAYQQRPTHGREGDRTTPGSSRTLLPFPMPRAGPR